MRKVRLLAAMTVAAAAAAAFGAIPASAQTSAAARASAPGFTPICYGYTVMSEPGAAGVQAASVTVPTDGIGTGAWQCDLYGTVPAPNAIRALETALNECEGASVPVDGSYPSVMQAVTNFQSSHGLTPDGKYGPETAAAMSWPVRIVAADGHSGFGGCRQVL